MQRPLALITGGVRRLGGVIATRCAVAGYDLALTSHVDDAIEGDLADMLLAAGAQWHVIKADLSTAQATGDVMAQVQGHFGRVPDLLVNNAAIFGQDDWTGMDAATLEAHFRLNMFAPVTLAKLLVAQSEPGHQPAIVHILDQRVVNPHGDQMSYTLSKQALAASVRTLAAGFGNRARVNGVAPGLVIETADYTADQLKRLQAMMPLGRLPKPQSIADAVLYFAMARDVTGQILFVDGGAHLKSFDRDFLYL